MSYFISKYHNLNIKQIQQFFINYTKKLHEILHNDHR